MQHQRWKNQRERKRDGNCIRSKNQLPDNTAWLSQSYVVQGMSHARQTWRRELHWLSASLPLPPSLPRYGCVVEVVKEPIYYTYCRNETLSGHEICVRPYPIILPLLHSTSLPMPAKQALTEVRAYTYLGQSCAISPLFLRCFFFFSRTRGVGWIYWSVCTRLFSERDDGQDEGNIYLILANLPAFSFFPDRFFFLLLLFSSFFIPFFLLQNPSQRWSALQAVCRSIGLWVWRAGVSNQFNFDDLPKQNILCPFLFFPRQTQTRASRVQSFGRKNLRLV
jgi:hypothetical protein